MITTRLTVTHGCKSNDTRDDDGRVIYFVVCIIGIDFLNRSGGFNGSDVH